jgi:hypothetical protein
MPETPDRFIKKYHAAVVMSTKDQTEKLKAKVASEWV